MLAGSDGWIVASGITGVLGKAACVLLHTDRQRTVGGGIRCHLPVNYIEARLPLEELHLVIEGGAAGVVVVDGAPLDVTHPVGRCAAHRRQHPTTGASGTLIDPEASNAVGSAVVRQAIDLAVVALVHTKCQRPITPRLDG